MVIDQVLADATQGYFFLIERLLIGAQLVVRVDRLGRVQIQTLFDGRKSVLISILFAQGRRAQGRVPLPRLLVLKQVVRFEGLVEVELQGTVFSHFVLRQGLKVCAAARDRKECFLLVLSIPQTNPNMLLCF